MDLDFQFKFLINARAAHAIHKKFISETPVYVSTEIYVYTCYQHFKATHCDKYKINAGDDMLQGIFRAQSPIKVCGQFTNDILFE
jgi:hypothetical protein